MRTTEKNKQAAPGYQRMQEELDNILTGKEPVAETTEVLYALMGAVTPHFLNAEQHGYMLRLLSLLNSMQVVQFQMERMVNHA